MSNLFAAAERVAVWTQPRHATPFTAWGEALRTAFEPPHDDIEMPEPEIDVDAIREEAFGEGFGEGLAAGRAEADAERAALARMIASLEVLKPEPTQALGGMIAATVERLLAELVGTVAIDRDMLIARAEAAAALIGEETRPAVLRLHPDDMARIAGATLPVPVEADPSLMPGAMRLETAGGWVEDGPAIRLEKLRIALDRVAGAK